MTRNLKFMMQNYARFKIEGKNFLDKRCNYHLYEK